MKIEELLLWINFTIAYEVYQLEHRELGASSFVKTKIFIFIIYFSNELGLAILRVIGGTHMKCPTCKEPNLVISERQGIEIDYCPECRGVWLDRGELDKILERSQQNTAPSRPAQETYSQQQQQQHNPYQQGPYQKPYKPKKSFLEEIFD